jgi:hypothetical protein
MTITFSNQIHENLVVTALEGGSNYWYFLGEDSIAIIKNATKYSKQSLSVRTWNAVKNGAIIPIYDVEKQSKKIGEFSLQNIERGENILVKKYPHDLAEIVTEEGDANTADVWFQLCTLGKVVYG